ncbi:MAG: FHIPEP family type III secretion protein [Pseudomonadota bacterium]
MHKDLVLVAIVVATLPLMVVPLGHGVIDILLAANVSLAVLLLLVSLYLWNPADFSTFPSVILLGTAFRLALSIGTTRLILSEADGGEIIEAFGALVVAGSIAIGLVIFLVITVVQFLVVTKGAERVAEVGARFALDALPGKQMSIDAELRAGNIDGDEASKRRRRLDREGQFFGAMDGAMKFVKGDAIAGLIIITINLLGGIAVGMSLHGMGFGEAVGVYSLLTIGDGLVAQIPALPMALCAGVIVARVANAENDDLGTDIFGELVADPRVLGIAAAVVRGIGFIPGFPLAVFAAIAVVLLGTALALRARLRAEGTAEAARHAAAAKARSEATTDLPPSGRIRLVVAAEAMASLDREVLKRNIATTFEALHAARGVRFPAIALIESATPGREVVVDLDEVPIYRTALPADAVPVGAAANLGPILAREGLVAPDELDWPDVSGFWVPHDKLGALEGLGYEVLELDAALARLAFRLAERNLGQLFDDAVFGETLAAMKATEPGLMAEIDEKVTMPALHRLLRLLVEDGVPIRPLPVLIGALHHWLHALDVPKVVVLAEHLRLSMRRQLCHRIAGPDGVMGVMLVDPGLETVMRRAMNESKGAVAEEGLALPGPVSEAILEQMRSLLATWRREGTRLPAVLVAPDLRRRLRNFLAGYDIHVPVLATQELSGETTTHPLGLLRGPDTTSSGPTCSGRGRVNGDAPNVAAE